MSAWTRLITLTTNEAYAWLARLLAGRTPAEAHGFAHAAYEEASQAPVGATQTIGSNTGVSAYVRIYAPMRDLVDALQTGGFDVWIISASPQKVSEVVAGEVGIGPDHVVGVRNVAEADGRLGAHLEPCGDAPADSVITFVLDRHRVQLMCNAYANAGGRWLVQPMFIEPMPPQAEPYPCATALDAAGRPITDEQGRRMSDQGGARSR